MRKFRAYRAGRRQRLGIGLIELMISLVIAAGLLTATAVAVDASFRAYAVNQEQSNLMQQARITMNRVLTTIRTSTAHAPKTSSKLAEFSNGIITTDTGIALFDAQNNNIIFRHDSANKTVVVDVNGTARVVCRGVLTFTVKMEPMRSATSLKTGGVWDELRRATVTLTVQTASQTSGVAESTDDQTLTLSASAVPRKNAW
jgi:type II secretory pathway component PulJ